MAGTIGQLGGTFFGVVSLLGAIAILYYTFRYASLETALYVLGAMVALRFITK